MVKAVTMPKLGQSEETVKIVKWRKHVGDAVAKGDIILEIETDKAVLEVESFFAGTLLKIVAGEGVTVPVQTTVAFIGDPDEAVPDVAPSTIPPATHGPKPEAKGPLTPTTSKAWGPGPSPDSHPLPLEREKQKGSVLLPGERLRSTQQPPSPLPGERVADEGGRVRGFEISAPVVFRISPRAAKLAKESAIDPAPIPGTGPGGRIVERDVRDYLEAQGYNRLRITPSARKLAAREGIDLLSLVKQADGHQITIADIERIISERPKPLTHIRQIIARRLTESYTQAPHFFVTVSADITELEALRARFKAEGTPYTLSDFIVKTAAMALEEFPVVNSASDGATVRAHSSIDIGLAVALEQGLVVPVIRRANELTLAEIHAHAQDLTARARSGHLTPGEMTGSTFTISNMGMLDVENFTAIINPGESAILAVSSGRKQPVVKDDQVVVRTMMKMTLSSDHRLIDGALAARFLNSIRKHLEETSLWQRLT